MRSLKQENCIMISNKIVKILFLFSGQNSKTEHQENLLPCHTASHEYGYEGQMICKPQSRSTYYATFTIIMNIIIVTVVLILYVQSVRAHDKQEFFEQLAQSI